LPTADAGSVLNRGVQWMVCTVHVSEEEEEEEEANAAYITFRCSEFIDGFRFEVSGASCCYAACKFNRRRRFGTFGVC
jgi:hypothetical protein